MNTQILKKYSSFYVLLFDSGPIHLDHQLNSHIKQFNPNYCSKLVWQAYFYGSGNLPVIRAIGDRAVVPPTNLPTSFTWNYTPHSIGRY